MKLLNQSAVSHKDIARQQAGSSIFPWQQDQAHSHQSLTVMETPSRRKNGPSGMSWSYDDTPVKPHQQFTSGTQSDTAGSQQMEQLKNINQGWSDITDGFIFYYVHENMLLSITLQ